MGGAGRRASVAEAEPSAAADACSTPQKKNRLRPAPATAQLDKAASNSGGNRDASAHRMTPPDEPSRDMASASAVATRSSAACRLIPSLRTAGWPAGGTAARVSRRLQGGAGPRRGKAAGMSAGQAPALALPGRSSRVPEASKGVKNQVKLKPHLNSESRKPQRKVEPEPSVVHGSRLMVPPMGQPYTCRGRRRAAHDLKAAAPRAAPRQRRHVGCAVAAGGGGRPAAPHLAALALVPARHNHRPHQVLVLVVHLRGGRFKRGAISTSLVHGCVNRPPARLRRLHPPLSPCWPPPTPPASAAAASRAAL